MILELHSVQEIIDKTGYCADTIWRMKRELRKQGYNVDIAKDTQEQRDVEDICRRLLLEGKSIRAIQSVVKIPSKRVHELIDELQKEGHDIKVRTQKRLSEEQRNEIIHQILEGKSNNDISAEMNVSKFTISGIKQSLRSKGVIDNNLKNNDSIYPLLQEWENMHDAAQAIIRERNRRIARGEPTVTQKIHILL